MRPTTSTKRPDAPPLPTASEGITFRAAQITQFIMSGGLATAIHWTTMAMLIQAGMQSFYATILGAIAGSIANYLLQFYWTFQGNGMHRKAFPAYIAVIIAGWCVNAGIFYFLMTASKAGVGLSQIIATATVAAMNYLLYKRIVFHERTTRELAS